MSDKGTAVKLFFRMVDKWLLDRAVAEGDLVYEGAPEEQDEERFLFPDEIREILRDCDDRTRIGIYDVTDGEWMEVYNYEVRRTPESIRYLSRYGTKVSEEDLAIRLYDAIEDGYTVTINGTDIFERWE